VNWPDAVTDLPYLWILGTVRVNYHTLSDSRVHHSERLERLLVDTVAALVDGGIVPLETIAQDGMRVRASAGSSSFRRKPTLEKLQQAAQEHVDRLKKETEGETERRSGESRRRAAAERAARERQQRLEEALQQHKALSEQRNIRDQGVSSVPPANELKEHGKDPHTRQRRDTDAYALFRARMAQPEYQALYKSRPSVAEFPNAECRSRNLRQFRVRGLVKTRAVAIWHALAFNLSRLIHLEVLAT
jgi:hypothetical protein